MFHIQLKLKFKIKKSVFRVIIAAIYDLFVPHPRRVRSIEFLLVPSHFRNVLLCKIYNENSESFDIQIINSPTIVYIHAKDNN